MLHHLTADAQDREIREMALQMAVNCPHAYSSNLDSSTVAIAYDFYQFLQGTSACFQREKKGDAWKALEKYCAANGGTLTGSGIQ